MTPSFERQFSSEETNSGEPNQKQLAATLFPTDAQVNPFGVRRLDAAFAVHNWTFAVLNDFLLPFGLPS
jgi:hypothetical protein